jgi:phosphate starvation-inducible PhoH-like protein
MRLSNFVETPYTIVIPDGDLLSRVCGTNDSNLRLIERHLGVPVLTRGNELSIPAKDTEVQQQFQHIIDRIADEIHAGGDSGPDLLQSIFNVSVEGTAATGAFHDSVSAIVIPGGLKRVYPKTPNQAALVRALNRCELVFCTGPAGTGKTYLAIAHALQLVVSRKKDALILTRPVVEAGESLGFLPGDLEQKINPYLRPLYDAIAALLGREMLRKLTESGLIEIAPLAYMRGRTLHNSVILLDEAQNTTCEQMKMFLTRVGEGSKVIVTGDITQIDLPKRTQSGLIQALSILHSIDEIEMIQMDASDVVRSPLVKKIVQAYEQA